MNRESALFLVIGLLAGFLAGYIAQEEMAEIQPPRIAPGAAAAMGPHAAAGAAGDSGTPMAQIEALRQRVEQNPNDVDALVALANMNFDIQNWARAKELYERVLAVRPGDPDILTDLGITLRAQGNFQEALVQFRSAQSTAPAHWQSRFNEIVVLALDLGDVPAAEQRLAELSALAPGNADVARLAEEIRKRKTGA